MTSKLDLSCEVREISDPANSSLTSSTWQFQDLKQGVGSERSLMMSPSAQSTDLTIRDQIEKVQTGELVVVPWAGVD